MKRWLPESLYRLKPLLLMLAGLIIQYTSKNIFLSLFAILLIGYACWILVMRLLWKDSGMVRN